MPAAAERNIDSAGESRKFTYRARRSEGGDMVRGVVEAVDHASAVRELRSEGMTMVIATHEMGFATQVADEVCFLRGGEILERGTPDQVIHEPREAATQEFLRRVHEAGRL